MKKANKNEILLVDSQLSPFIFDEIPTMDQQKDKISQDEDMKISRTRTMLGTNTYRIQDNLFRQEQTRQREQDLRATTTASSQLGRMLCYPNVFPEQQRERSVQDDTSVLRNRDNKKNSSGDRNMIFSSSDLRLNNPSLISSQQGRPRELVVARANAAENIKREENLIARRLRNDDCHPVFLSRRGNTTSVTTPSSTSSTGTASNVKEFPTADVATIAGCMNAVKASVTTTHDIQATHQHHKSDHDRCRPKFDPNFDVGMVYSQHHHLLQADIGEVDTSPQLSDEAEGDSCSNLIGNCERGCIGTRDGSIQSTTGTHTTNSYHASVTNSITTCSPSYNAAGGDDLNARMMLPVDFMPKKYSVLFGRGKTVQESFGNQRLQVIVGWYKERYQKAKDQDEKSAIVNEIIETVREGCQEDNRAAFIRYRNGRWWEVEFVQVRDKIGSMLRNSLPGQYKSSSFNKVQKRRLRRSQSASIQKSKEHDFSDSIGGDDEVHVGSKKIVSSNPPP